MPHHASDDFEYVPVHFYHKELDFIRFLIFLGAIIVFLLFIILIYIILKRRRHPVEETEIELGIELVCASSELETEDVMCMICLAQIEPREQFTKLPCSHYYHLECIEKWFHVSPRCPICCRSYSRLSN